MQNEISKESQPWWRTPPYKGAEKKRCGSYLVETALRRKDGSTTVVSSASHCELIGLYVGG